MKGAQTIEATSVKQLADAGVGRRYIAY
ncbi:hypothetical protein ACLB1R_23920 [Escherichia coli]